MATVQQRLIDPPANATGANWKFWKGTRKRVTTTWIEIYVEMKRWDPMFQSLFWSPPIKDRTRVLFFGAAYDEMDCHVCKLLYSLIRSLGFSNIAASSMTRMQRVAALYNEHMQLLKDMVVRSSSYYGLERILEELLPALVAKFDGAIVDDANIAEMAKAHNLASRTLRGAMKIAQDRELGTNPFTGIHLKDIAMEMTFEDGGGKITGLFHVLPTLLTPEMAYARESKNVDVLDTKLVRVPKANYTFRDLVRCTLCYVKFSTALSTNAPVDAIVILNTPV